MFVNKAALRGQYCTDTHAGGNEPRIGAVKRVG